MNATSHHNALLEKLAAQPNLIVMATKRTPQLARRAYHRQMEFLADIYGVTVTQLERKLRSGRQFA